MKKKTFEGKSGIKATVIADSITESGIPLVTYEVEFPRFILGEVNTHKMLTKSGMSSRAIPFESMVKSILEAPASPVYWGKNQPGMKAKEELDSTKQEIAKQIWDSAIRSSIANARELFDQGVHKQIVNRLIEVGMMQKMLLTGTDWANFFWLRNHEDAQPEFHELASLMQQAKDNSIPNVLLPGEWHLPYVHSQRDLFGHWQYFDSNLNQIDLDTARKISASCAAQTSYRKSDDSVEKALDIFGKLGIGSTDQNVRQHVSPTEHQGTPIPNFDWMGEWPEGVTAMGRDKKTFHSGNLRGWIQYRHLIPNNTKAEN